MAWGPGDLGLLVTLVGSATVGAAHALLPDHWIPYVLLSRARRWDVGRSLIAAAAGGLAHLAATAAVGLLIAFAGAEALPHVGPIAELAGFGILAGFGLFVSWRGFRLLRSGRAAHGAHEVRQPPPTSTRRCLVEGALLGARPCAEALAIFLASAAFGLTSSLLAVVVWVLATLGVMIAVVWLSLLGLGALKLTAFEKYAELTAGLVILLMGLGAALLTRIL